MIIFVKQTKTRIVMEYRSRSIGANGLQLNADFVFRKICDLGAVRHQ
jgi:hypothetical protein